MLNLIYNQNVFNMIKKFGTYVAESIEMNTVFDRNNSQWSSMYPELKMFILETDYIDDSLVWFYSFNKEIDNLSFDMLLEIRKSDSWELAFELIQTSSEDEHIEQEKHYNKKAMLMDRFQSEMSKICRYIQSWNEDMYEKTGIYPLID
jgi:hypothetical protein